MTTVTAAVSLKEFAQFAEGERPSRQKGIQGFLAELSQRSTEDGIKEACLNKLSQLKQSWDNPNTLNSYVGSYRNGVRAWQKSIKLDESNSFENPNGDAKDTHQERTHYALRYFILDKVFYTERNKQHKEKSDQQRRNGQPFNPFEVIATAEKALNNSSYLERCAAFEFLTGRRPTEVLKREGFKQVGKYAIEFSAQLKRKAGDVEAYQVYTLTEASKIISALDRLNREGDLKELEEEYNSSIDSRRNSSLNSAVRRIFKGVLLHPLTEKRLSNKNLRAAYIQAASVLFRAPTQSMSQFAEELLGHKGSSAVDSYEDYVCLDADGNEMPCGQWRNKLFEQPEKPKSRKPKAIYIDEQRKERFLAVEGETQGDRLDTLLNTYEERPSLLAKIEELQRQVKVLSESRGSAEPEKRFTREPDIDWSMMPSEELKGNQAPGSAEEKIKRAIAAILDWNKGKSAKEQYRLSEANARYVSGSRHGTVKAYFAAHPKLQDEPAYHFGVQHDRGKTSIGEVVSW